ncbi:MAG: tRNA uridine-5-carboxymethylaminomethyl(34) synthesis GTPase MnmE [Nitrospirae bacterium]|nr:tRNA uridine-5-carboxymethylaminomethyl(34) synthesis GTPase MnmE [Nitrospirota bacterium]
MKRSLEKKGQARPRPPVEKNRRPAPGDTICAIATPVGEGGIGVIRLSGGRAIEIASEVFKTKKGLTVKDLASHTIHLGAVRDSCIGEHLDEVMLAVMRAPKTYTRLDTVEIYSHGGTFLLHRILDLLIRQGARLAEPGEFTKWAFLNGRIDLTQAEAVMDLIRSKTEAGHRAALAQLGGELHRRIAHLRESAVQLLAEIEAGIDFTEEDLRFLNQDQIQSLLVELINRTESLIKTAASGKALREGIATAIVGPPNAGKSSLLNALLLQNRAIVTPIPGTTRDIIEEYLNLDGIPLRIMDTAGLRDTEDLVEREGILRTRHAIEQADLILLVLDVSQELGREECRLIEETAGKRRLIVCTKIDLPLDNSWKQPNGLAGRNNIDIPVYISAKTGEGIDNLREVIVKKVRSGIVTCGEREAMINTRHKALLLQGQCAIKNAAQSLEEEAPPELIAMDIRTAIDRLGEITGETTTEDLLEKIFKDFCIGK